MKMRAILAWTLFVMAGTALYGQTHYPPVEVLALPIPDQTQQPAITPLLIPYSGKIDKDTVVRVFRGSKKYLMVDKVNQTKDGECVLYTSTDIFAVVSDGHMLHVDQVVSYFNLEWYADHQTDQQMTLVFEHGGQNVSSGQLRLSKDSVNSYFEHAVELPLYVPQDKKVAWDKTQRKSSPSFLDAVISPLERFMGPAPVYAATKPVVVQAAQQPVPTGGRNCQAVHFYPLSELANAADGAGDSTEVASLAFSERSSTACGD